MSTFLGEDAVERKVPKTIENQRVYDETMVDGDEEVDTTDIPNPCIVNKEERNIWFLFIVGDC